MIEYPSIINSSKAPREPCLAFEKLDGSNIRVKYSKKNGFHLFGSRERLFDETHPFLAEAIPYFHKNYANQLTKIFTQSKEYSSNNVKEIVVFGEFFGEKSYAGIHDPNDLTKKFVLFDVMAVYKDRAEFAKPQNFVKTFGDVVEIPKVVYEGNLTNQFIKDVRENKLEYTLNEGVICKGTQTKGSFRGKVWMCKIKTQSYLDGLKTRFGADWEKYAE